MNDESIRVSPPVVGIDLRQFFSHPYASGIQRVLLGMLEAWPLDEVPCRILCEHQGRTYFISEAAAARCIRACFDHPGPFHGANHSLRQVVANLLDQETMVETTWPEAALMVDRWFCPEPTTDQRLLGEWRQLADVMPTSFLFYDALPQVNPEFYEPGDTVGWSSYFRLIASAHRVISISQTVADDLAIRLRNTRPCASGVAHPGADHVSLGSSDVPATTSFLVLSSVEKRKRIGVLADAFSQAAAQVAGIELHVVGRRSSDGDTLHRAVGVRNGSRIRWSQNVNDASLGAIASQTTALFSIGEEGYGMPVLEMLRRGCPVAFAGTQPAAELAIGAGAMKLRDYSPQTVAEAMVRLADPVEARALRSQIDGDRLPTWSEFAHRIAGMAARLHCGCPRTP